MGERIHNLVLIEDRDADAMLIEGCLKKMALDELKLVRFPTMAEGIRYLEDNKGYITLLLLDLGLPDTEDAHDTIDKIRKFIKEIPVIVLTGMEDHDLAVNLVEEGIEDFINKKILHTKPKVLKNAIDFAVSRHHHNQKLEEKSQSLIAEKDEIISWMSGDYSVRK